MNVAEIKRRVKRQFGDDSGIQIYDTDIVDWANDAQKDIVRKTECLQSHVETGSVSLDGSYVLPDDLIKIRKVSFDGKKLEKTTLEVADHLWPERDSSPVIGTPTHFYVWGGVLYIYPYPTSSGSSNLDIWYVPLPVELANDGDIPQIPLAYHEDIVRYCLGRAKELDEEDMQAKAVMVDYEDRISQTIYDAQNVESDSYPAVRLIPGDY